MAKLLVLANLQLTFEVPGDASPAEVAAAETLVRRKERRLLRALRALCEEDPAIKGSLEQLELEAFTYASELQAEATGYYYNKHERAETP